MFLRKTSRFKDGKVYDYWSVAENSRAGRRVVQRQLLYLGEIDEDRQNAWLDAISELDFWTGRLPRSSHGTDWLAIFKAIVLYRLTSPGSEWRMHRDWYDDTAVRDLLGESSYTSKSTLYGCLDRLVAHKDAMFEFLRDRWAGLFASSCRVILYDLTSTYFEVDGTKAETSELLRHGYSRDKRGDCLQVVIALVLTPDGLPLAYEVMPGNTSDKGTQMRFVDRLVKKYGKDGKLDGLWLMDRGVPTEETPKPKDTTVTQENFSWSFDLDGIREARRNEGTYLLRTNMTEADPAVLWKQYMIQGEIEQSFKEVKNDLGLRPVYHQLDSRIEAHIFVSYVAYCLQATLKNLPRSKTIEEAQL